MKSWAMNETRRKPQTWQKRAFPRIGCWQRGQSLGMAQEDRPMGRGLAMRRSAVIKTVIFFTCWLLPGCATLAEQDQLRREVLDNCEKDRIQDQRLEAIERRLDACGGLEK